MLGVGIAWRLDAFPGAEFENYGVRIGAHVPDARVYAEDGTSHALSDLWGKQPVLLVTASLTCPVSRGQVPKAERIAAEFGGHLTVVVLYTLEAHPEGDPSPYNHGEPWQLRENREEDILRAQTRTLEDREHLATEFRKRLHLKLPILLDNMDNLAWKSLGGGPNMALLIRENGVVEAKEGWFDDEKMSISIRNFLNHAVVAHPAGVSG